MGNSDDPLGPLSCHACFHKSRVWATGLVWICLSASIWIIHLDWSGALKLHQATLMSRNHYSWESSLEAMAEERNTLNYGIQKAHWSLSDTQAYLLPAWPCSQPEGRNMVMSSSTCVSNGKDGSSAAPLVLLRWLQFDLPSQIPCTLYKSECPTLSLVTDSKEGLRTGEHRFSLYQMPLKPLRSTSL